MSLPTRYLDYMHEQTTALNVVLQDMHMRISRLPYRGVHWSYYHQKKDVASEWIRQRIFYFQTIEQSGQVHHHRQQMKKSDSITNAEDVFRTTNILPHTTFKMNFTDNFLISFQNKSYNEQLSILAWMQYVARGYLNPIEGFFEIEEIQFKGQKFERMFTISPKPKTHLVFMITVQQTPVTDNNQKLLKVQFEQTIVFLDFVTPNQLSTMRVQSTKPSSVYSKVVGGYLKEPAYKYNHELLVFTTHQDVNSLFKHSSSHGGKVQIMNDQQVYLPEHLTTNPLYTNVPVFVPNKFVDLLVQKRSNRDSDWSEVLTHQWNATLKRWCVLDEKFLNSLDSQKRFEERMGFYVINQCLNFGSASKLVQVIQRIPNFHVKISSEQEAVIGSSGNVVCIGRSGTGKTTSAVLRMFSLDMLFKYRMSAYLRRHNGKNPDKKFISNDIDKNHGIRCLFVTASPVLTNEIKRYYHKLTNQLKEKLIQRDERLHAEELEKLLQKQREAEEIKKAERKALSKVNVESQSESDPTAAEATAEHAEDEDEHDKIHNDLMEQQEMVEKMIECDFKSEHVTSEEKQEGKEKVDEKEEEEALLNDDEDEIERQMDQFETLRTMNPEDFPAFMTIRNLIMLVDASLQCPFFKRDADGKIKGQTAQNTWHNEQKGTLFINNYHKKTVSVKTDSGVEIMETFATERILDSDDDEYVGDDEKNIETSTNSHTAYTIDRKFANSVSKHSTKIDQITASKTKLVNGQRKMAYEVDFEYFSRFFWRIVQNKFFNLKLDALLVWTEIYSTIKGSTLLCSSGGLGSKGLYLEEYLLKTQLNEQEAKCVYQIYTQYEDWKSQNGCYDLLDLVNHIIRQLKYGYNQNVVMLHYIMVDEVQDLPMNILYLMRYLSSHGTFYSGDTAQTITQGVGFRYGNLKSLFESQVPVNNGYGQPQTQSILGSTTIQQLTVNYRSHNRILYLANSVIDLIEQFFPDTIDRLKKERSLNDGPKPIIMGDTDEELLFFLLSGKTQSKSDASKSMKGGQSEAVEFGCSQVVIVRNQESKKKLPAMLQHALCLTIYEAKGLEFDDVILYNFFQDSTMNSNKWNILRYLTYTTQTMSRADYADMLKEQEEQRMLNLQRIQSIRQTLVQEEVKKKLIIEEAKQHASLPSSHKMTHKYMKYLERVEDQKKLCQEQLEQLRQLEIDVQSNAVYGIEQSEGGNDYMHVVKLGLKMNEEKMEKVNSNDFAQLCLELKQLYVAVTRPKKRIIIYDSDPSSRAFIQDYWTRLGCVEVITKDVLEGKSAQENVALSGINVQEAMSRKSDVSAWKNQGLRMMKLRYFEQAMFCFERANEPELKTKARVFFLASHAKESLEEAQREQLFLDQGIVEYASMTVAQKSEKQAEITRKIRNARREFTEVGDVFAEQGLCKQAAKCYFSSLNYEKAGAMYYQNGNKRSAAECFYILKQYEKAADIFLEINEVNSAIECYDFLENTQKILEVLHAYKDKMAFRIREFYLKKYASIALEELVKNIGLSPFEIEQKKQIHRQKVLDLIQKDQIEEEDEDDDDEEEDQEEQEDSKGDIDVDTAALDEEEEEEEEEQVGVLSDAAVAALKGEQEVSSSDCEIDLSSMSEPSVIQEEKSANKKKTKGVSADASSLSIAVDSSEYSIVMEKASGENKKKDNSSNESFSVLGDVTIEELMNDNLSRSKNQLSDFDHLSNIDPDDEWLQLETESIAEVIHSRRSSGQFNGCEFSSFIDLTATRVQMIKTSADIFIQDDILQSIIRYLAMFSDRFAARLRELKQQQGLIPAVKKEVVTDGDAVAAPVSKEAAIDEDVDVDLDNLDQKFIEFLLDTLEHYKIFRLSIFVCNRFNMTRKAGRYLLSIAHRFSPYIQENVTLDTVYLNMTAERQRRIEKSIIANIALHNIFEVINPEYLRLKEADEVPNELNSLGLEVYRGLMMLGFWRKILYVMDYKRSLSLAAYFADFRSYKTIFIQMNKKYKLKVSCLDSLARAEPDFDCLPFGIAAPPTAQEDLAAAIIALQHVSYYQVSKPRFAKAVNHSLTYNVAFTDQENLYASVPAFPSYFPLSAGFWKFINAHAVKNFNGIPKEASAEFLENVLAKCFKNAYDILQRDSLEDPVDVLNVYDTFIVFSTFTFLGDTFDKLFNTFIHESSADSLLKFGQVCLQVVQLLSSVKRLREHDLAIVAALLVPLKARLEPLDSDLFDNLGSGSRVCVSRTSKLVQHFVNVRKSELYQKTSLPLETVFKPEEFNFEALSYDNYTLSVYKKLAVSFKYQSQYDTYKYIHSFDMDKFKQQYAANNPEAIETAMGLVSDAPQRLRLAEIKKQYAEQQAKFSHRFFFLDVDCDFVSAPLTDALYFLNQHIEKMMYPALTRRVKSTIKSQPLKQGQISQHKFVAAAYNIGFVQLLLEADRVFNVKTMQSELISDEQSCVASIPAYKKVAKTNALYQMSKQEYIEKMRAAEQEAEADKQFEESYSIEVKKMQTYVAPKLSINKQLRRALWQSVKFVSTTHWNLNGVIDPYVRSVVINSVLKSIRKNSVHDVFDLKKYRKTAKLINVLGMSNYLGDIRIARSVRKYTNRLQERISLEKNGLVLKMIDNTLDHLEVHFNSIDPDEKISEITYCVVWALIAHLQSKPKDRSKSLLLNQSLLPMIPFERVNSGATSLLRIRVDVAAIPSDSIITDLFTSLNDVLKKQHSRIESKLVLVNLLKLACIVLTNLKEISADLADELLNLFEHLDDNGISKFIYDEEASETWGDLVSSKDADELEDMIPSLLTENRRFFFEIGSNKSDPVEEVSVEVLSATATGATTLAVREARVKDEMKQNDLLRYRRVSNSLMIKSLYEYNKQSMARFQQRLSKNRLQMELLSFFHTKEAIRLEENAQQSKAEGGVIVDESVAIQAYARLNAQNSTLFRFFNVNTSFVNGVLSCVSTQQIENPLDFHYLMELLQQSGKRMSEYQTNLRGLLAIESGRVEDGKAVAAINSAIQKLAVDTAQKEQDLLSWSTIQLVKVSVDRTESLFMANRMNIAIKWAKIGQHSDAIRLIQSIKKDIQIEEAEALKINTDQKIKEKLGNKLKANRV